MIYLDNAATTKIHPEVLKAMLPYLEDVYGNPGSLHKVGRMAADAVRKAREQVAYLINCAPDQIIFTSSGSEANNLVFKGLERDLTIRNQRRIAVSEIEHDSVLEASKSTCSRRFSALKSLFYSDSIKVNFEGIITAEQVEPVVNKDTGLVSVMYVNNETGNTNPVREISDEIERLSEKYGHKIYFHSDCVQALGSIDIDVDYIGADFISLSGHKIHAPKGVGALYARDKTVLNPLISGGNTQEFGLRGGTENVAGIVGFGKACELAKEQLENSPKTYYNLNKLFVKELEQVINAKNMKSDFLKFNSKTVLKAEFDPGEDYKILNLRFKSLDSQTLLLFLEGSNIMASAGSACTSHEDTPSHVLKAIGLTDEEARSSIRISFSSFLTEEEVIKAAREVGDIACWLKDLSLMKN